MTRPELMKAYNEYIEHREKMGEEYINQITNNGRDRTFYGNPKTISGTISPRILSDLTVGIEQLTARDYYDMSHGYHNLYRPLSEDFRNGKTTTPSIICGSSTTSNLYIRGQNISSIPHNEFGAYMASGNTIAQISIDNVYWDGKDVGSIYAYISQVCEDGVYDLMIEAYSDRVTQMLCRQNPNSAFSNVSAVGLEQAKKDLAGGIVQKGFNYNVKKEKKYYPDYQMGLTANLKPGDIFMAINKAFREGPKKVYEEGKLVVTDEDRKFYQKQFDLTIADEKTTDKNSQPTQEQQVNAEEKSGKYIGKTVKDIIENGKLAEQLAELLKELQESGIPLNEEQKEIIATAANDDNLYQRLTSQKFAEYKDNSEARKQHLAEVMETKKEERAKENAAFAAYPVKDNKEPEIHEKQYQKLIQLKQLRPELITPGQETLISLYEMLEKAKEAEKRQQESSNPKDWYGDSFGMNPEIKKWYQKNIPFESTNKGPKR